MITQIDKNEVPKKGQYPTYKVVMFGASQVGKTSLLQYLDTGKFTETTSSSDVSFYSYHSPLGLVYMVCLLYVRTCIQSYVH